MSAANPAFFRVMTARTPRAPKATTCEFCLEPVVGAQYMLLVTWDHTLPPGHAGWETATGKVHYECRAALTAVHMLEGDPLRLL